MATKVATPNMKKVKRGKIQAKEMRSSIPNFGFKSAFVIVLTAAFSSFFLPNMLAIFGIDTRITTLLANSILISLAVCYCQFFIETNRGFGKDFIRIFLCFLVATGIISYFWLYIGLYM